MIIGTLMDLETCQILGQVPHNFTLLEENLQTDICGPGGGLTRKQLTSRPDHLWPETLEINGKARQAEGEAKVVE